MIRRNLKRWSVLLFVIGITFGVQEVFAEEAALEEKQEIYYEESTQSNEPSVDLEIETLVDVTVETLDETEMSFFSASKDIVRSNDT